MRPTLLKKKTKMNMAMHWPLLILGAVAVGLTLLGLLVRPTTTENAFKENINNRSFKLPLVMNDSLTNTRIIVVSEISDIEGYKEKFTNNAHSKKVSHRLQEGWPLMINMDNNTSKEDIEPNEVPSISDSQNKTVTPVNITKPPENISMKHRRTQEKKTYKKYDDQQENINYDKNLDNANIILFAASFALVVGATAARRLTKKRLFLAGFFETESMEDEIAYDAAYTTAANEGEYGSFSSPWTGDLDKFDV